MTTDTSENGLESLICAALTGFAHDPAPKGGIQERPADYGPGWMHGDPEDYDREYCADLAQLSAFLLDTQPDVAPSLDLGEDSPARRRFLARLQSEIAKRGTIDVLRQGIKHGPHSIDLFYGTPSPGNVKAQRPLQPEPFQRHPPTPLQHGQRPIGAGPVLVHQRPSRSHLRAEEQPHQADG